MRGTRNYRILPIGKERAVWLAEFGEGREGDRERERGGRYGISARRSY